MTEIASLKAALHQNIQDIESIDIQDNSYLHAGHAGYKEGYITHIKITISSPSLVHLSKVKQHQIIYKALAAFMNNPLHAIEIKVCNGN
ncbi:BolA family protein [Rickettsiales endosymbiont of Stachyamoeba lipophora]|uniref:BolA family protein n=1 Tax=Rickettsiales endosymbiont of Stachyamoeba lipophora TaxID=2486578 RepID=UPI000F64DDF2|nr:BolA family protein [Rickettsiales endosymbiont of Stachyamoeba lipophora]AZL16122.1 BolA family transcriptional regulator [Rickettsiales endosymbiont of Stachyamoeba lipophora]